jgi:hypothetical protein
LDKYWLLSLHHFAIFPQNRAADFLSQSEDIFADYLVAIHIHDVGAAQSTIKIFSTLDHFKNDELSPSIVLAQTCQKLVRLGLLFAQHFSRHNLSKSINFG